MKTIKKKIAININCKKIALNYKNKILKTLINKKTKIKYIFNSTQIYNLFFHFQSYFVKKKSN